MGSGDPTSAATGPQQTRDNRLYQDSPEDRVPQSPTGSGEAGGSDERLQEGGGWRGATSWAAHRCAAAPCCISVAETGKKGHEIDYGHYPYHL